MCSASGLAVGTRRRVSTEIKSNSSQTSSFLFADSILHGTSRFPASICIAAGVCFLTKSFVIMWNRECSEA